MTTVILSCSQKHEVEGYIAGIGNDTVFIEYMPVSKFYTLDEPYRDTIISENGKFTYDNPTEEPIILFMFPQRGSFKMYSGYRYHPNQTCLNMFLLPNKKIKVDGRLHEYYLDYDLKGSHLNKQLSRLREHYNDQTAEAVTIELQIDSLEFFGGDNEVISRLYHERNQINQLAQIAQLEFLKTHPNQDISAYYLARQQLDTVRKYYNHLSPEVLSGIFKPMLEDRYIKSQKFTKAKKAVEEVQPGSAAPIFTLKSLEGDDFTLQSVDAEYIVLDFWGSWCGPCILGFPKMKEYYQKYKNRVEFVGIACNDKETKWKQAVEKHKLPWLQVINNSALDQDVSVSYGVMNYPTKFILDQNKEVVAKFIGEGDDFYQKLDDLMAD